MVTGIHYFGTTPDHEALLDHLGEPEQVSLHAWPILTDPPRVLDRQEALAAGAAIVVSSDLGPPTLIRPGDAAMRQPATSGLFNRLTWEHLTPRDDEGLIDSNASPVLLWRPGSSDPRALRVSDIGSQADSMKAVSPDYEQWVKRIMAWIRRRGTRVWGLDSHEARPDLDIALDFVNSVYALPGALAVLETGTPGRQ